MPVTVLRPKDLLPDERVMWKTAEGQWSVPSWYVRDLLARLQETRDELEQIKSGENFSAGG